MSAAPGVAEAPHFSIGGAVVSQPSLVTDHDVAPAAGRGAGDEADLEERFLGFALARPDVDGRLGCFGQGRLDGDAGIAVVRWRKACQQGARQIGVKADGRRTNLIGVGGIGDGRRQGPSGLRQKRLAAGGSAPVVSGARACARASRAPGAGRVAGATTAHRARPVFSRFDFERRQRFDGSRRAGATRGPGPGDRARTTWPTCPSAATPARSTWPLMKAQTPPAAASRNNAPQHNFAAAASGAAGQFFRRPGTRPARRPGRHTGHRRRFVHSNAVRGLSWLTPMSLARCSSQVPAAAYAPVIPGKIKAKGGMNGLP